MSGRTKTRKSGTTPKPSSKQSSGETTEPKVSHEDKTIEEESFERPPSPLSISRSEEKEELGYLNDRLATYIDYVRSLQNQNEILSKKVSSYSENYQLDTAKVKTVYENEIESLRKALDEACNGRTNAEVKLRAVEAKLDEAKKAKSQALDTVKTLERQLEAARNQLEHETVRRTKLENHVLTLQEKLELNRKLYEEEISQIKSSIVVEVQEEVKTTTKMEYESKLADELRQLRAEAAEELDAYRESLEKDFRSQYKALQEASEAKVNESAELREEMKRVEKRLDEAQVEISQMTSKCQRLNSDLDEQRRMYEDRIARMKEIERGLREKLDQQISDFADLMTVKVALDQEIMAYRKLLEGEENRCHLTPPRKDTSFSRTSPSRKRSRVDLDESEIGVSKKIRRPGSSDPNDEKCEIM